jgi:hypothetical protein
MLIRNYHNQLEYYQKGDNPQLLITSGMHGDESETSHLLYNYVYENYQRLPEFLYIPFLSPSAVAATFRQNDYGHDLNRSFTDNITDPEALQITKLLGSCHFDLVVDFHEDKDRTSGFYMFDEVLAAKQIIGYSKAQNNLHAVGLRMFNGVEDMEDPNLGFTITDGYIQLTLSQLNPNAGFMSYWLLTHQISDRVFTIELPKKAKPQAKSNIFPIILDLAVANLAPAG